MHSEPPFPWNWKESMAAKTKDYVLRLNQIQDERRLVAPMCKTHFTKQPMKISKGVKQYVFDDMGYEFLDCCGNVAHVGHCHPLVVHSGQQQMGNLTTAQGFMTDVQSQYAKALLGTVPEGLFDTVLLVNSGSEAVDLALRLAQSYTKRQDIVCHQPSIYGHSSILSQMNYKFLRLPEFRKQSWVHHLPICNSYRGPFSDSPNPVVDSVTALKQLLAKMTAEGTPAAAFLTETINTSAGNLIPPMDYLPQVVNAVKEAGGLVILDEVLTGLGRLGTYWWAFQHFGIIPDIIVCGRSLGNGQPLAAVMTSQTIACSLLEYANSHGGNPVSCAMGSAVLEVIRNERLLNSCAAVGRDLLTGLTALVNKHEHLGDVRGQGLCFVLDIVQSKKTKEPSSQLAERLSYRLRDQYRVLVPVDGPDNNCLFINPPMCFSLENSSSLVHSLDLALTDIGNKEVDSIKSLYELNEEFQIPMDIFTNTSTLKRKSDEYNNGEMSKTVRKEDYEGFD